MWLVPDVITEHHCQLDEMCSYPADTGGGYSFSILDAMRVAQVASRELSRNISKNLPSDYTPLTLAEVFYMATMGGARGINLSYYKWSLQEVVPIDLASSPGSLLKNGGRREPGNICRKSCQLPVPGSGGTNQIAEQNHVYM